MLKTVIFLLSMHWLRHVLHSFTILLLLIDTISELKFNLVYLGTKLISYAGPAVVLMLGQDKLH